MMDINKINDLAKILRQNQLAKLELAEGESRLVLEAAGGKTAEIPVMPADNTEDAAVIPVIERKEEKTEAEEQKSPLVGTVYLAPQAGAEPFVRVGDRVEKGDVLCIVESMKMFNNIEAAFSGTIEEVCVDNGQVVEFGQTLVKIIP